MLLLFSSDVLAYIFNFLSDDNKLNLRTVHKYLQHTIDTKVNVFLSTGSKYRGLILINLFKKVKLDINSNKCSRYITVQGVQLLDRYVNRLSGEFNLTDSVLNSIVNVVELDLTNSKIITDTSLKKLINLKKLTVCNNDNITDTGVETLTNLTSLVITKCCNISSKSVKNLINLKSLSITSKTNITDSAFPYLINLTMLELINNRTISDKGLKNLKLSYLMLRNCNITDKGICNIITLVKLDLEGHTISITDNGIKNLVNLKCLKINKNHKITLKSLKNLTNLRAVLRVPGDTYLIQK